MWFSFVIVEMTLFIFGGSVNGIANLFANHGHSDLADITDSIPRCAEVLPLL